MNASLLNALSAAISDNPVHVLQLRKIVVALAISGRLNGADASIGREEILALLDDVKRRLISQRILAKQKPIVAITHDQLPDDFSDPSKFISLGQIARVEKGKTGIQQAKPGPYPLVVTAAERITADHFDFDGAAAIIPLVSSTGHGNASINRLHYQEGRFALGTILAAVLPHDPALFSARFLFEYLSAFKEELLVSRMSGTANVTLTLGRIEDVPIPLVPPVIQQQLDELMALCDELEAARTERETKRDRLAAASLARLNTPDPETFRDDARFTLDALPALTARPDQFKQLRQAILNLAVSGKLVPQDPADEPAWELLKRIAKEKARRVTQRTLREPKPLRPIEKSEIEFDVPLGWQWVRMAEVIKLWNGYAFKSGDFQSAGVPVIRIGDLQDGEVTLSGAVCVSETVSRTVGAEVWIPPGALLIAMSGATTGKTAFNKTGEPLLLNQRVGRIEVFSMSANFLRFFFETIVAKNLSISFGTAIPNLSSQQINETIIPLPPLAEQHRIVAKVDELMALCDQLETSLTSADETRKKLLDALLAEALAPVDVEALQEAAE